MTDEVRPASLSDADLDKQLKEAFDKQTDMPPGQEPDKGPTETTTEPEPETPAETVTEGVEDKPVDEVAQIKGELQKLQEQHRNLQLLYGRQSNELGDLRKRVADEEKALGEQEPTDEDFATNPKQATKKQQEIDQRRQQLTQEKMRLQAMEVHGTLQQSIPTFNQDFPEVMKMLAQHDGVPLEHLQVFQQNPFQMGTAALYHMTKRAQAMRDLASRDQKIAELEGRLAEAKKAPGKIAETINKGQRAHGSSTVATAGRPIALTPPTNLARMSDEELDRALEAAKNESKER